MYDRLQYQLTFGESAENKINNLTKENFGSLPEILNISTDKSERINTVSLNGKNILKTNSSVKLATGSMIEASSIIDGALSFTIDFLNIDYSNSNDSMNDIESNVKNLFILYNTSAESSKNTFIGYYNISRDYLFDNFYIFELPDYSIQAMTSKNYDYILKILYNDNLTNLIYDKKIHNRYVCIIKSYTLKKIWILIDSNFVNKNLYNLDVNNKITAVFDFNYRNFETTAGNNYLYFTKDSFSDNENIQDLINNLQNKSQYYDIYKINKNTSNVRTHKLLNNQSFYFSYIHNYTENASKYSSNIQSEDITNILLRNTSDTNQIPEIKYSTNHGDINKSLSYDVFGYKKDDTYVVGEKISSYSDPSGYTYYEIFPYGSQCVHYLFKIDETKVNDISIENIKNKLLYEGIYLASLVNENNTLVFKISDTYYTDILIEIPKLGKPLNEKVNKIDTDNQLLILNNPIYGNIEDSKSSFDPTITYEKDYETSGDKYYLPYFQDDTYIIESIQQTNNKPAYIKIVNDSSKPINLSHNLLELRENEIDKEYVNVALNISDYEGEQNAPKIKDITETFNFRELAYSTISDINEKFSKSEELDKQIALNAYKIFEKTSNKQLSSLSNSISENMSDFFICIITESNAANTNSNLQKIKVNYTISIDDANTSIIPIELKSFKIDNSTAYYAIISKESFISFEFKQSDNPERSFKYYYIKYGDE